MGEDPSTRGAAVTSSDTDQIEREIEATREALGDTVEALAEKADVKRQARRKVEETRQSVSEKKDELLTKAREASPENATAAATAATQKARENPTPLAVAAGFLFGFMVGRLSRD